MAVPSLTLRLVKNAPLTFAEMDTNLTNLQTAVIGVSTGSGATGSLSLNDTLTFTAGTGITLSLNTSTKALTINSSAAASTGNFTFSGDYMRAPNVNIQSTGTTIITSTGTSAQTLFLRYAESGSASYSSLLLSNTEAQIEAIGKTWAFNSAGNMVFPDSSVQSTAYVGTATTARVGGVKIGSGVSITADGTISVAASGGGISESTATDISIVYSIALS